MMANTHSSFFNNGELYLGDPVSARKTACRIVVMQRHFSWGRCGYTDKITPTLTATGTSYSLSTKLVDKYVNYAWVF
jgi:hypothetical protein